MLGLAVEVDDMAVTEAMMSVTDEAATMVMIMDTKTSSDLLDFL
jgi:hypothetical protein